MQDKKSIKSFKALSKVKKKEIFDRAGKIILNPRTDKKFLISIARQLSEGFENDLRKEVEYKDYRRAKKVVKEYFAAVNNEKVKLVRPRKNNRKYYAEFSGQNKKSKIYIMPALTADDKYIIKNKKIKRVSEYSNAEIFKFNQKKLAADLEGEAKRIWNKIEKKYKKRKFSVRIKFAQGELSGNLFSLKAVIKFLNRLFYEYQQAEKFVLGLIVYTFRKQENLPINRIKKKKENKRKKK